VTGLVEAVRATLRRHAMLVGGERVLVAVSGGADSAGLLHALHALAPSLRLTLHVLHVDHGLRADSSHDAAFVQAMAARLGVACEVVRVTVSAGGSPEAQARAARYAALEGCAERVGAARIAVGHTRDDQAETVLMRVLEGAGPRGLAGIPFQRGRVIRPLLEVSRREIVAALRSLDISWMEDPSNLDRAFFRNRVRHHILPFLAMASGADPVAALNRTAVRMRALVETLDARAEAELKRLAVVTEDEVVLPHPLLSVMPRAVAATVLRLAASRLGCRAPLRAWAHRGLSRVLCERPLRRPFRLGGVVVEVSGAQVRLAARPRPPLGTHALVVPGCTLLDEIGAFVEARVVSADGYELPRARDRVAFDVDALSAPLIVRARRPGDHVDAFGGGERRVKSLLIDAKVPRWERARVPVIEAGGQVVWVAGLRRAAAAPLTSSTRSVLDLTFVRHGRNPHSGAPERH